MLKSAGDADLIGIVDLMNLAYRGPGRDGGWSSESGYLEGDRTTVDLLRADIAAEPAASLLKWEEAAGGRLLGCVWLAPREGTTWYLGSLAVDPGRQNGGLGRTVLEAAEAWVRARGGTRVRMSVINVRVALIEWYERRGYRLTGVTEPFPYGDDRFGRPLRDDLQFVVLERDLVAG